MKNYIERVTNLERTKEEYVPRKLFNELYEKWSEAMEKISELEDSDIEKIKTQLDFAESATKQAIKVYTLDAMTKTTQRPMDICPYCECKMHPKLDNSKDYQFRNYYRPMNYVVFECEMCGAKSPKLYFNNSMLDKVEISKQIEDMLTNMDGEEEEE